MRAIIGPNGAGKSSMLNVINGVYRPQQGTITYRGRPRHGMDSHAVAEAGIARTFQNIALFRGMSVLDNIMTGRNLKMHTSFVEQALWWGRARREELLLALDADLGQQDMAAVAQKLAIIHGALAAPGAASAQKQTPGRRRALRNVAARAPRC